MASAPRVTALTGFGAIPQKDVNGNVIFATAPAGSSRRHSRPEPGWRLRRYVRARQFDQDPLFVYDGPLVRPRVSAWIRFGSLLCRVTFTSLLSQSDLAQPLEPGGPKVAYRLLTRPFSAREVYRTGVPTQNVTPAMIGPTAFTGRICFRPFSREERTESNGALPLLIVREITLLQELSIRCRPPMISLRLQC